MKKTILILFSQILCTIINAQEKRNTKIINDVIFGLNGAGDISGYIVGIGVSKNISSKNAISVKIEYGQFKASKFDVIELGQFQSDNVFGISTVINNSIKLGKTSSFKPEAGIFLRNHRWIVTTKTGFLEKGKHYVPPHSQDVWNDKTIGYTIALPFTWKIGEKLNMSLGPVYQNDTFGYSIFGGRLGLYIDL